MHVVEFIPADWLERAACWPGLTVYSRPVAVERRVRTRRTADVELLLRSLLSVQVQ
jgi:hypothetical protein